MGEIFVHEGPHPEMRTTGERLTVGHGLETEIEHFHRYYLARSLVRGRDVLDIASGEGYGSAMLAQTARSVLGVDVSEQAVAHARSVHRAENLSYEQGDACHIPAGDASVDVVTSFETLEHFYDHDAFFAEVKRVLRPGGLLVLSTPDRDVYSSIDAEANPFHVRELTREEFEAKCRQYFTHADLFAQFAMLGSVIAADPARPSAVPADMFERRRDGNVEHSRGAYRAKYCICIASDGPLPEVAGSFFVHSYRIDSEFVRRTEATRRDETIRELHAVVALRDRRIRDQDAAISQRDRAVAELGRQSAQRARELLELQAKLALLHELRVGGEARLEELGQKERDVRLQLEKDHREYEAALAWHKAERDAALAQAAEAQAGLDRMRTEYINIPVTKAVRRVLRKLRGQYRRVRNVPRLRRARSVVSRSALFQADWYLHQYPDVRMSGMDPALHYARFGALEGRNPSPMFDGQSYLRRYPDVRAAGINPLVHYETKGRAEGRLAFAVGGDGAVEAAASLPARAEAHARNPVPSGHRPRVVYVSGEPHTPGHFYRVTRYAEAARLAGAEVTEIRIEQLGASLEAVRRCDLLVIWRARMTADVRAAITAARAAGAKIQYDVDDLMFEPELARVETIDGIRSQGFSEAGTAELFGSIAEAMTASDFCSAPTEFLAGRLQRHSKPSFVLPNGFDETVWRAARLARRARVAGNPDGLIRIGYAAGSKTHQKDFAVVAPVIGRVLRQRPNARLVLFRLNVTQCLVVDEFPELRDVGDQIEWREMVPVNELTAELARFDVSIAPLELGNPFCEAKSELKFFESALVEVPLVATPTSVFRRAIEHGRTGYLARTEAEWEAAITQLIDDPELRRRVGRAAYHAVLWPFGTEARVDLLRSLLVQRGDDPAAAAVAFELELDRRTYKRAGAPEVPPHRAEIIQDRLEAADVTVVVPLYNYEHFVVEALDSVREQSLERIDLVVVDDCSTDQSARMARDWMVAAKARFGRMVFIRNDTNVGLGLSRNIGIANAETTFVIQLDADNRLLPDFAARCLDVAKSSGAAFVYPIIRMFGDDDRLMGTEPYDAQRLACGNYIDAMALLRVACWAEVGGYDHVRFGWEDYDLWCRFAERGWFGQQVPELLAMYRVHGKSMLRTVTDVPGNKRQLVEDMRRRHPWASAGAALDRA